jgi:ADP-ribosylglycohydrolase
MGGESSTEGSIVNYAYLDDVPDYTRGDNTASIDFLSTSITSLSFVKKSVLRRVRATYCMRLTQAVFSRLPNLEAIDLVGADNLASIEIKDCPRLRALDLGLTRISSIPRVDSLEYLGLEAVQLASFPPLIHLKFLEYTPVIPSTTPDLALFPELEVLRLNSLDTVLLSTISAHPTLRVFNAENMTLNFDSVAPNSHLAFVSLRASLSSVEGDVSVATERDIFVGLIENTMHGVFNPDKMRDFQYVASAHLLYGPWGIPQVDALPDRAVTSVIHPPEGCVMNEAVDAIMGSIFGGAVGDWIGLGAEFVDGSIAKCELPEPIDVTWSHARVWRHNYRFVRGTPTDDTSQAILILRSIVDANTRPPRPPDGIASFSQSGVSIDLVDFAAKLKDWVEHGHSEHKHGEGLGCGRTTFQTLSNPQFDQNPIAAATAVWEALDRNAASNGSVMRISTSACFGFWDEALVKLVAEKFGQATHADPRCVYSTLGIALLISRIIRKRSGLLENVDLHATLAEARAAVPGIEEHSEDVTKYSNPHSLEELELSGNNLIGYCLKTFGSAIWALKYAQSFEDGIARIVREGGDADTNASAAGALLGAKFGFETIPRQYIEYMFVGQWLWREIGPYLSLMGLPVPASPYLPPKQTQ